MCIHRHIPKIKINAKTCDACGECATVCPKKVFITNGKEISIRNLLECTLCNDCVDACLKQPAAIDVSWDKNAFIMILESTGVLPPERIVSEALDIMEKKTDEFLNELTAKESEKPEEA